MRAGCQGFWVSPFGFHRSPKYGDEISSSDYHDGEIITSGRSGHLSLYVVTISPPAVHLHEEPDFLLGNLFSMWQADIRPH